MTIVTQILVALALIPGLVVPACPQSGPPVLTGVWAGVMTMREMPANEATALVEPVGRARLTLREDQTWTLVTAEWEASGIVVVRGEKLLLHGRLTSTTRPSASLGPAEYVLDVRRDEMLAGSGTPQFLGTHVVNGMHLRKVKRAGE